MVRGHGEWQAGAAGRSSVGLSGKQKRRYINAYHTFADALEQIGHFIEVVYQHKRIHSALGYLTPAEFKAQWFQQHSLGRAADSYSHL